MLFDFTNYDGETLENRLFTAYKTVHYDKLYTILGSSILTRFTEYATSSHRTVTVILIDLINTCSGVQARFAYTFIDIYKTAYIMIINHSHIN